MSGDDTARVLVWAIVVLGLVACALIGHIGSRAKQKTDLRLKELEIKALELRAKVNPTVPPEVYETRTSYGNYGPGQGKPRPIRDNPQG